MPRRTLAALSFGLFLAQTGCIAFPFVTPPLAASVGGAMRRGLPASLAPDPPLLRVDVGVRPFQLLEQWQGRRGDVGFGYAFETGAGPTLDCVYAEGVIFPLVGEFGRLGIHAQPRVLFGANDGGRAGFGLTTRVSGELRTFASAPFSGSGSSGGAVGYAHGEGAISFYLEGAYEFVYERPTLVMGLGVGFRIPASAGVAIAFLR